MKRVVPFVMIALALGAFVLRDRWLPAAPGQANYLGYVEGETILVAAPVAGRILARVAVKGASVNKGDILFSLDAAVEEAELLRSSAAVATARAQLENLRSGRRREEQDVTRAQRREADANLVLAKQERDRAKKLTLTGTAAKQRLDQAEASVAQWQARVEQYEALERAGSLAARGPEIEAANSRVKEAEAAAQLARTRVAELSPVAPRAALVENTFFDAGEWAAAGQPIVSLLAPDNIVLRFFVPEGVVARLPPGTPVRFRCDGCEPDRTAVVTHVASEPEYTPPIIYSQAARAKLVFMVEARPSDPAVLRPGLPIEVEPLP